MSGRPTPRSALAVALGCLPVLLSGCGALTVEAARPTRTVTASTTVTVTATPATSGSSVDPAATSTTESPTPTPTSPAPTSPSSSSSSSSPAATPAPGAVLTQQQFAAEFDALRRGLTGLTGIAVAPVGGGPVLVAGPEQTDLAWSTIKVPISIAALRDHDSQHVRRLARRTITVSDNAAASSQWGLLGAGDRAAHTVDQVLREYGDAHTSTDAAVSEARPWRFGATSWAVHDAAAFAAQLPCHRSADPVLELMGQIDPGHRWGLGRLPGARFKGGWGPQRDGFVTRQLGVVPARDGKQIGVALLVRTSAGMEAGNRDLDRMADWVRDRADRLPAGRCR